MILYHGSSLDIPNPDLLHSRVPMWTLERDFIQRRFVNKR